ncbi:efflux RND transporter periplasmic adaptor subunit [Aliifodinibius sp. S!AR15-10]|uniref:efflux RND transporter periplasmic adaptor subunit n=1 Tax=Aliifodinibius sp. S!AR15-10 TaxID=2950437 RepID=UPI00285A5D1B|nr:efflux RND transporter periplasmic adaptor subunit [Aliifodinibius sp. S!AR15-10]MDR8390594.1 efflux RND transporter periplasmic adaptor subunit [Aliifodinibius sp. S!AR15-10]
MNNSTIPHASRISNLLTVVIFAFISACNSSEGQQAPLSAPTVTVSAPIEEEIAQYDEFTGRFRAIERVEIRARVDGYLQEIKFRDGQLVEKGEVLFVIDQRPYKIALEQAHAELESAQTRLELSKKELQRAKNLRKSGAVSQELIDRRNQEFLSAKAAVNSAQAAVHSAELNLDFTEVKGPISGKISENFVSVGNLVSGGLSSATLLTRIVSLDPIYFTFEASESKLISYLKNGSFRSGIREGAPQTVAARLLGEDDFDHKGRLDFVDNEINQSTGTMLVRAVFPNEDLLLTPGMFAKAKFSATGRHRELLVPDKAIGSDQSQRYVLVVDDSSQVGRKFVETGKLHNDLRIIEGGLSKTDRVVISGLGKVRPGQKVNVNQGGIALAAEDN